MVQPFLPALQWSGGEHASGTGLRFWWWRRCLLGSVVCRSQVALEHLQRADQNHRDIQGCLDDALPGARGATRDSDPDQLLCATLRMAAVRAHPASDRLEDNSDGCERAAGLGGVLADREHQTG